MKDARTKESGGVYVEAAIATPIMLLVTFASLFFFLCAARQASVQMLANEIAKDLSLALRAQAPPPFGASCIQTCRGGTNDFAQYNELYFSYYINEMYVNNNGCWKSCAATRYLLSTTGPYPLSISITPHHVLNWFDTTPNGVPQYLSPGDFFTVTLQYPLRAVLGSGISMFGLVPDNTFLVGTAMGVMERS